MKFDKKIQYRPGWLDVEELKGVYNQYRITNVQVINATWYKRTSSIPVRDPRYPSETMGMTIMMSMASCR